MRRIALGSLCLLALLFLGLAAALPTPSLAQTETPPAPAMPTGHIHPSPPLSAASDSFFLHLLKEYTPRRVCMFYEEPVIWLHFISDALISLAYFSIPFAIVYFVRKRKAQAFGSVFRMFAAFILACGTTHILAALDIWQPYYRIEGLVKLITAVLSVITAIAVWKLMPQFLAIPSASELEQTVKLRTSELQHANLGLQAATASNFQAAAHLRAVVDSIADGLITCNPLRDSLEWNTAALEMHGFASPQDARISRTDLNRHFALESLDGQPIPMDAWPLSRALKGEKFVGYEVILHRLRLNSDRIISYSGTPILDSQGTVALVVLSLHDVTEHKQAEKERERLLRAERKARTEADRQYRFFNTALSNIHDYTFILDRDGRFLYANKALLGLWNKTSEQAAGMSMSELGYPPDVEQQILNNVHRVYDTASAVTDANDYTSPEGIVSHHEYILAPILGSDGHVELVAGSSRDMTERTQADAERETLLASERAARGDAERANHLKDEFLANLSHELRTPLNAILGWSHILRTNFNGEPELNEGLNVIERNANAQTQLIGGLLEMSRVVSGTLKLSLQYINLRDVVGAALTSIAPAAEAKKIRFEQQLADGDAGPIRGDPTRLQQVVWNILTNATKFTPPGGCITVSLHHLDQNAHIVISDTGQGIPSHFLPHVFERFRQLDGSTTRQFGGLGIGLSIAKSIVEAHGGTVTAESPGVGKGATFTVILPLASGPAKPIPVTLPPSGIIPTTVDEGLLDLTGIKVLIIDDEPDDIDLIARLLRQRNAEVLTANSAAEALERFTDHRPHILLSDIGMPTQDGYQLIRQVRTLPPELGGSTPAIALTAFASDSDRQQALLAGFQSHISKPLNPTQLLNLVAILAKQHHNP